MTVRELIENLETSDPDKPVLIYDDAAPNGASPIAGIDSYEDVLVLVGGEEEADA